MASGTADLQRDLGGALLTSIFGALLTAGYASAMAAATAGETVTESTQSQLQLSYASAADLAAQNPADANAILAAAKSSFLDGDQWAYTAGAVAIVAGAVLVLLAFPRHERETGAARRVPRPRCERRLSGSRSPARQVGRGLGWSAALDEEPSQLHDSVWSRLVTCVSVIDDGSDTWFESRPDRSSFGRSHWTRHLGGVLISAMGFPQP